MQAIERRSGVIIQRLKDQLSDASEHSSEVQLELQECKDQLKVAMRI